MPLKRFCLALDLKDDPELIEHYKEHHQKIWPGIVSSIKNSGIRLLEIYCTGNRLCMMLEADEDFSFERKAAMDAENPEVQAWEQLMWQFQQALPWAKPGEKWILMEKIFVLPD